MAIEKLHIEQFLELAKQHPVLDVRSPGEYKHAHIPGAHSFPLFTDEERKIVGTAYKQQSREQAIKIGLDFFGVKMRKMVEEVESIVRSQESGVNPEPEKSRLTANDSRLILVHCWRGGMRSAGVAWLLDLYGFKVYTLVGGYKKFRNYVLEVFKLPFQFNILGGYTGSGKTGLLKTLKEKGQTIIDLEGLANHKGSAFGNIGMPEQPGQEMFENLLATELRQQVIENSEWKVGTASSSHSPLSTHYSPVWLEDESQRIGQVNIPHELWKNMRQSPVYFLDIPFEERLKHIVQEYGPLDPEKVADAITRISQKLGHLNAKKAILLIKEGKMAESFDILLKYYDKHYFKSLHNREGINSLLHTVSCKSIIPENANLLIPTAHHLPQKS
ncbi:MAG: tRNA 2-selenouridine(34) synthase MnmH [Bacteroidota bacterium]|nr:tRNA 2-selenouridine(34) synthase MnmH [Bacteroidota bacterium]